MSLLLSSSLFLLGDSSVANDIVQTAEGDYIIVGRIYNPNGNDSGFATRINASGAIIWRKIYSSVFSQFLKSVAQLNNGSYVATGSYFYSAYAGNEYTWVINFDNNGDIIWQSAFGTVGIQSDGYDIKATKDGGFIVCGLYAEKIPSTYVLKFNSKGKLQWDKKYDIGVAFSITQTLDDGYALVGRSNTIGQEGSLENPPFILRLDNKGNVVWKKIYEDYQIYVLLDADIIENTNGHFAIVAKTLLMEVDSCGNIIWAYNNENFRFNTILETSDNSYCVGGNLVVNYFEHAYIATLNRAELIADRNSDKKIIWDNIDTEYNSGFNSVIADKNGWLVNCGYIKTLA